MFYNRAGNLLDINHLRRRVFYKAPEKAKMRRIRHHELRHIYATLRIQAGHNITDVSKQLGHHSSNITVDTYYHWMPGNSKSEVNQLDSPEYQMIPGDNAKNSTLKKFAFKCTLYPPKQKRSYR